MNWHLLYWLIAIIVVIVIFSRLFDSANRETMGRTAVKAIVWSVIALFVLGFLAIVLPSPITALVNKGEEAGQTVASNANCTTDSPNFNKDESNKQGKLVCNTATIDPAKVAKVAQCDITKMDNNVITQVLNKEKSLAKGDCVYDDVPKPAAPSPVTVTKYVCPTDGKPYDKVEDCPKPTAPAAAPAAPSPVAQQPAPPAAPAAPAQAPATSNGGSGNQIIAPNGTLLATCDASTPCGNRAEPLKESNGVINPTGMHMITGNGVKMHVEPGVNAQVWDCFTATTITGPRDIDQACEVTLRKFGSSAAAPSTGTTSQAPAPAATSVPAQAPVNVKCSDVNPASAVGGTWTYVTGNQWTGRGIIHGAAGWTVHTPGYPGGTGLPADKNESTTIATAYNMSCSP